MIIQKTFIAGKVAELARLQLLSYTVCILMYNRIVFVHVWHVLGYRAVKATGTYKRMLGNDL